MLSYVIVVNDNGELKTIADTEFDAFFEEDHTMESIINAFLDLKSMREEQRKFNEANGVEQEKK